MLAEAHAQRLLAALVPLHAYAQRGRGRADLSAYQMNHICELEAALHAAADLLDLLNPPDTPVLAAARRCLAFHQDPAPLSLAKLRHHYPDATHPQQHPSHAASRPAAAPEA